MSITKLMQMNLMMIVDNDNSYFNDYGQLWNTRQFFKYDFAPDLTKKLDAKTYKNELKREGQYI